MIKIASFFLLLFLIISTNNYAILSILFVCIFVKFLILSEFDLNLLKKLRTPIIIYTSIAIINYFLNLQGLVVKVGMIDIYVLSLLTSYIIWIKLISISTAIFNLTLFQDKFKLIKDFKSLFGFLKIFRVSPQKIAQQIVLMLIFVVEIIKTFELNTKKEGLKTKKIRISKIKYNFIDKLIDKIKLALSNCEAYYKKFNTENSENIKNMRPKNNIVDIIFIILYTIIFSIRIYIKLVF